MITGNNLSIFVQVLNRDFAVPWVRQQSEASPARPHKEAWSRDKQSLRFSFQIVATTIPTCTVGCTKSVELIFSFIA